MTDNQAHFRIMSAKSLKNSKEVTTDSIAQQIKAFKKKGGKIEKIPRGISSHVFKPHISKAENLKIARKFKL